MSRSVKAQREANQSNEAIQRETNKQNYDIAHESNQWNWANMQAQNEWNIQQWERENAYNDPSAQMERYIQAGINPVWALGNGDPGNSAHLESAAAAPASVATMEAAHIMPEYDPTKLNNIVGASQNLVNSLQGFTKLGLEATDVETRRQAQQSQAGVNLAEALWKKSQTAGQDIFNNLNIDTYSSLVGIKQQEYDNLVKQGKKTDEEILNEKETRNQIIAMTDYTWKQGQAIVQNVDQAWRRLQIDQQNAHSASVQAEASASQAETAAYNANTNRIGTVGNLYFQGKTFDAQVKKDAAELKLKSTSELIQLYDSNKSWLERNFLGNFGTYLDRFGSGSQADHRNSIEGNLIQIQAIGDVLKDRYSSDPSQENFKALSDWFEGLNSLPLPSPNSGANSTNTSILNPSSESWLSPVAP